MAQQKQVTRCTHRRERITRKIHTDAGLVELVVCVACDGRLCASCGQHNGPTGADPSPNVCDLCGAAT